MSPKKKPSDATSQKIRTLKATLYQGHKLIHICTSHTNLGASASWEHTGHVQSVQGLLYLFFTTQIHFMIWVKFRTCYLSTTLLSTCVLRKHWHREGPAHLMGINGINLTLDRASL